MIGVLRDALNFQVADSVMKTRRDANVINCADTMPLNAGGFAEYIAEGSAIEDD